MTTWNELVPSRDELHEVKRGALLREAASAFTRQGFHATSLDDIAHKLGVTKAALYHYFPGKHALLRECFTRALQVCFRGLDNAQRSGRNGREKLRMTLCFYLNEMIDELSCCVVLTEENALLPEDRAKVIGERDRFEQALRDLVNEGIDDGSIVPCDPKLAVFGLLGAINWVPKWFRRSGPWTAAQLSEALTDMLDRMISAAPVKALPRAVAETSDAAPKPAAKRLRAGRAAR